MATESAPPSKPWYLCYPIASFIALISAGAVTVAMWTVLVALAKLGTAGDLGINIVAWLAYVVIVVALFTIVWYFQPGTFTSIIVTEVSKHAATNGNPPVVTLQVHQVLSGDPKADRRKAIWLPEPLHADGLDEETNRAWAEWRSKPLTSPKPGSRWILLGAAGAKAYEISWVLRLEYSDDNRSMAMKAIGRPHRPGQHKDAKTAR